MWLTIRTYSCSREKRFIAERLAPQLVNGISRSPRAIIQLRGVPPYLARHPEELLTSREAVVR